MSTNNICFRGEREALLMNTHNIRFHGEIRKIFIGYPPLSRPMTNRFLWRYNKISLPDTLFV